MWKLLLPHFEDVLDFDDVMDTGYPWSKFECFLKIGCQDIIF